MTQWQIADSADARSNRYVRRVGSLVGEPAVCKMVSRDPVDLALVLAAPEVADALAAERLLSDALAGALEVLAHHASETYPHFEDTRGQMDLRAASAVLARHDAARAGK